MRDNRLVASDAKPIVISQRFGQSLRVIPITIVSGGQTGVDRGALDVALEMGVSCGGWCPANGCDELGLIPNRYPLQRLESGGYLERTRRNVEDSDATLVIYFSELEGGTAQTVLFCLQMQKQFKLIDATETTVERAAELVKAFVAAHRIAVLNVAGPRASTQPQAYEYARGVLRALLLRLSKEKE